MHERSTYSYAIVRVVPRVDREEFVNVGVIVCCPAQRFLEALIEIDEQKLRALGPALDLDLILEHLSSISAICAGGRAAGPIGELPAPRRFEWLVAPKSTIIQTSPVHTGSCTEPAAALQSLMESMVRAVPSESSNPPKVSADTPDSCS
ncbi:MAG TPA: DUF3037 domain-containing protein [Blastocatellia bacterium]